jgi:hypothetical protein
VNVADSGASKWGRGECGDGRGCSLPFYSGWSGGRRKRPAVMALMPLMAVRLDDGLRGEIKRGNQGVE